MRWLEKGLHRQEIFSLKKTSSRPKKDGLFDELRQIKRQHKKNKQPGRKTVRRHFKPKEAHCPYCWKKLTVQHTKQRATIYGLKADYSCKLFHLVCKNQECKGRYLATPPGEKKLRVYGSTEFKRFAVPRHRLTWELLCEIGRLRFEERMSLESIQKQLDQQYQLNIAVQRLADWTVLYEATCLAWWKKHPDKVKQALNKLEERVYLIDYTEDTTKQPVFRVFIAGIALNLVTKVVEKPKADAVRPVLKKLDQLYGAPDLIVCDDDDTIKNACTEVWPDVPIQACFEHLLRNLLDTFLEGARKQAHNVLQQTSYRKTLKNILISLKKKHPDPWPEHGEDLRELIELLLYNPPGGNHASPPTLQKLQLFKEVRTHLNYLFKAIRGQKLPLKKSVPELQDWQVLKNDLSPDQQFQGLMDSRLLKDPFYRALLHVKKVVDAVCEDLRTDQSLQSWHSGVKAINRLRSFHWALKVHQLKKIATNQSEGMSVSQKRGLHRLIKQLTQQLASHKREVSQLTTGYAHVPTLAVTHLQKLIDSWKHQGRTDPRFEKAATQLMDAAPNLLHFINVKTAPASQQEIEGQNNRLKQVFRQQSGHVHSRHRFVYHAEGTSAVLNFHAKNGDESPMKRLGIDLGPSPRWLADLSWTDLQQAKRYLLNLRQPRRDYLKVRKKGLEELRKDSIQKWTSMVLKSMQPQKDRKKVRSVK